MKKAIFITVRTGSSRLPNKCLLEINGKTTIEHLIDRMKRSKKADIIVLCTTKLKEDDILCEIAKKNSIKYYRGSAEDKLMRWHEAAKIFDVEFLVTGDGDDLFYEPELVDLAFDQYEKNQPDFIEGKGIICGSFTYAIKASALEKVCEVKDTEDTEMMWVYFTATGLFKTEELRNVPAVFKRPEIRMTMDYQDDFKFFKIIIEHFSSEKNVNFTLRDIIGFLDKNPEIVKINQYLQEKYLKNQKKKTKLVLKAGFAR